MGFNVKYVCCVKITYESDEQELTFLYTKVPTLIVGCTVLIFSRNVCSWSAVPVQIMNLSSIYLFHSLMRVGSWAMSVGSSLPMNRFAYDGAILVPIAVPCSWRK